MNEIISDSIKEVLGGGDALSSVGRVLPFEDYSHALKESYSNRLKCVVREYVGCSNNNLILEGSFNRLMSQMGERDFAIISAYRNNFTKGENILRNRHLRGVLNASKMGVHQLVGHWQEAPEGKEWNECKPGELTDVIERSYFIAKPEGMPFEEFRGFIADCLTVDGATQDCGVIHQYGQGYYCISPDGGMDKIGDKLTLGKVAQAYSQYVKRMDVPFVFEGVESPSSNGGCRMFKMNNILY